MCIKMGKVATAYSFSRRFKKLLGISPKEYRISKNAKAKKKG